MPEEKQIEVITPIYSGKFEDFHWVGFGSGSGTNLDACAKEITPLGIFSNMPDAKLFFHDSLSKTKGIEHLIRDSTGFVGKESRPIYDKLALDDLQRLQDKTKKEINLIVLGGYMRIVSDVLLKAFPDKIINVHPSLLYAALSLKHKRAFTGDKAVYDVIKAGQRHTGSSVIIVDEGVDHGEILTQGPQIYPDYSHWILNELENPNRFRDYIEGIETSTYKIEGFQSQQKRISDWPALTEALQLIAQGRLAIGSKKHHYQEWRRVYLDDKPLGYSGYQVPHKKAA